MALWHKWHKLCLRHYSLSRAYRCNYLLFLYFQHLFYLLLEVIHSGNLQNALRVQTCIITIARWCQPKVYFLFYVEEAFLKNRRHFCKNPTHNRFLFSLCLQIIKNGAIFAKEKHCQESFSYELLPICKV